MKIIKRGVVPGEKSVTTTCENCETKFKFLRQEATQRYDQRDGDYLEIHCPVCRKIVTVANSVID